MDYYYYQVKFVFEAFKKLRPGIPLKCLHGRMKQERRMGIYSEFCEMRSVLFSTDVASRGLDFNKAVDWVVQVLIVFFFGWEKACVHVCVRACRKKEGGKRKIHSCWGLTSFCLIFVAGLSRRCCILHTQSWSHCSLSFWREVCFISVALRNENA
jgi:hypothetical protein